MSFNRDWMARFGWPRAVSENRPLAIAHRGASDYRTENSLEAFNLASDLFAEMWELDLRVSADGVAVVSHDDDLDRVSGHAIRISESTWDTLHQIRLHGGYHLPRLEEVVDLARARGAGLYIEVKSAGAAQAAWRILDAKSYRFAAIGSFVVEWVAELRAAGCPYPLSVLVPTGRDPLEYGAAARPDILHLCWRDASPAPHELVTPDLVSRCWSAGAAVVLWHENRREVLDGLDGVPVLGICSNCPECLKPSLRQINRTPEIVCHRGANFLAPENTLPAAEICIAQKFDFVEIDVRTTADGELVVLHDPTLDRTTDGAGPVAGATLAALRALDAGSWQSDLFAGTRIPTLREVLTAAKGRIGLYIELKAADPQAVLAEVRAQGMLGHVFFWSGNPEQLRAIRAMEPAARLMAARWMYPSLATAVADYGANIVEFEFGRDDLGEIGQVAGYGAKSMIFSLTANPQDINRLLTYKPDMVNLDRPDLFKIAASYPDLLAETPVGGKEIAN